MCLKPSNSTKITHYLKMACQLPQKFTKTTLQVKTHEDLLPTPTTSLTLQKNSITSTEKMITLPNTPYAIIQGVTVYNLPHHKYNTHNRPPPTPQQAPISPPNNPHRYKEHKQTHSPNSLLQKKKIPPLQCRIQENSQKEK